MEEHLKANKDDPSKSMGSNSMQSLLEIMSKLRESSGGDSRLAEELEQSLRETQRSVLVNRDIYTPSELRKPRRRPSLLLGACSRNSAEPSAAPTANRACARMQPHLAGGRLGPSLGLGCLGSAATMNHRFPGALHFARVDAEDVASVGAGGGCDQTGRCSARQYCFGRREDQGERGAARSG
jgi:hypothetical protein